MEIEIPTITERTEYRIGFAFFLLLSIYFRFPLLGLGALYMGYKQIGMTDPEESSLGGKLLTVLFSIGTLYLGINLGLQLITL